MTLEEIAAAYSTTKTAVAKWMRTARKRGLAPDIGRQPLWAQPCPHCGASASVRRDLDNYRAPRKPRGKATA